MTSRSRSSASAKATAESSWPMQVWVVPDSLLSAKSCNNRSSTVRIRNARAQIGSTAFSNIPRPLGSNTTSGKHFSQSRDNVRHRADVGRIGAVEAHVELHLQRDEKFDVNERGPLRLLRALEIRIKGDLLGEDAREGLLYAGDQRCIVRGLS